MYTLCFIGKQNEPFAFPAAAGTHLPTRRDGKLSIDLGAK